MQTNAFFIITLAEVSILAKDTRGKCSTVLKSDSFNDDALYRGTYNDESESLIRSKRLQGFNARIYEVIICK